ncbi:MAG TPA: ATP-binding protein [Xanthobacteraceae bacterium]|jgi:two-component system cell cycle sensor histidine kinase/response regulator CckA|nr:ATP-binding protein [Xanthobacteraceae bacterium]
MAMQGLSTTIGERGERRGSIVLVLLVAGSLIAAAAGLMLVGRSQAGSYVIFLLAILGMIGVFSLFALAAGVLRISGRETSDSILEQVLEHAQEGIVVNDGNGRVLYANAAYRAFSGAIGMHDVRPIERVFVGDPDVSETVYRLLKASRDGRRLQEEVRIAALRGEPARWLRLRVRPLGAAGAPAAMRKASVWTVADVTRDRERQENVFQELQHAIDYLDHAPAGFFSVDANGDIGYINATLAGWLDYDLAQVGSGGLRLVDLLPGDSAALLTALSAHPGEVRTEILDLDLRRRDGRPLPVRLYHKVAFAADATPGASRTLVLNRAGGAGADPLRDAEVRFMRFFNNTPMAIATVDRNGRIARNNALFAHLFQNVLKGETPAQGRTIRDVVAEGDRAELDRALAAAARGQSAIAPIDAAFAGEAKRWARFYVTPVEDAERDSEAAIVYAIETTEQRLLQDQADQAQKMDSIGKLAGGIAHDFNNLLNSIFLATDFLLNAHKPSDPSFRDIMQIKQDANRAASLVRHLLTFSRRQPQHLQVLDLGEALEDLSVLLRRLIGERIALGPVERPSDLWAVKADQSQFEQVIVNLAVNARDAMPDGGKLTLRAANVTAAESRRLAAKSMPPGEYVLVEVSDTGTGIPPDIIDHIFEPFFSTKEVGKGTGLGLSTVYGIVKQTGGFIHPESIIGKGTTFRIFLPRYVPAADPSASAHDTAPAAASQQGAPLPTGKIAADPADDTGRGTILLVEDEEGLRGLNARGLTSRGYTVLQAANGLEAVEAFDSYFGKIDLVVSDVVMPEMDGPTLLTRLRSRDPDVKIIFVSGYAEEAFEKNLPEGEKDKYYFLAKPFTLKQLVAAVKETMSK